MDCFDEAEGMGWDQDECPGKPLVYETTNDVTRMRLFPTTTKDSGVLLHALPISTLGLLLDYESLRISVELHLGIPSVAHRPLPLWYSS